MFASREDVVVKCAKYCIPSHSWGTIERYIFDRIPGGSFFTALVTNNLMESVARADAINVHFLKNYVDLMYNEFPSTAWGSPEKVSEWLRRGNDELESRV